MMFATTLRAVSVACSLPWLVESKTHILAWAEKDYSEGTCAADGLSPGVCAMAALAKPQTVKVDGSTDMDFLRPEQLERAVFVEVQAALEGKHAGFSQDRVAEIERDLKPMFSSLPKNGRGRLDHASTRYALHRRFSRLHGWHVHSLNPAGDAQKPPNRGEELRGRLPIMLQGLVEKEVQDGLGLRELAVLVATMEHIIDGDMIERLKSAYSANLASHKDIVDGEKVSEILLTYMAHYASLDHRSGYALSPVEANKERAYISSAYNHWPNVEKFVSHAVNDHGRDFTFEDSLRALKGISANFEELSNDECTDIQKDLLGIEERGRTGKVSLLEFHGRALKRHSAVESTDFLRKLGALDESDPTFPRVIIPNFVTSPSNCLGTTSFFDLCCRDRCEVILEHLEQNIAKSEATPEEIAAVIASLPSGAAAVGGTSSPLFEQLQTGAQKNKGRLALHGYDFGLWMHSAFPYECPRPRKSDFSVPSGAVPDSAKEFQDVVNVDVVASNEDLLREVNQLQKVNASKADAKHLQDAADGIPMLDDSLVDSFVGNFPTVDVVSFAQTGVTVEAAARDASSSGSQKRRLRR